MKPNKNKDRSMLYAALIGFVLFALIPALLIGILSFLFSQPSSFFPEGTEVEVIDNIGGFPAFGTKKSLPIFLPSTPKRLRRNCVKAAMFPRPSRPPCIASTATAT